MTKKGVQHETTTNIYRGVQNAGDLDLLNGAHTTAELCWQHQLNAQLLSHWKSEFLERASQVFEQDDKHSVEQERIADLEHLIRRLAMELEIAKEASLLLSSLSSRNGL